MEMEQVTGLQNVLGSMYVCVHVSVFSITVETVNCWDTEKETVFKG